MSHFCIDHTRLDVALSLITGLNPSWTTHLQNVFPHTCYLCTRHWSCSAKCILKHQKKAEFDYSKFCEEKESENITSLPRRQSFSTHPKSCLNFRWADRTFFLNISKAKHLKTTSITFCGIPVPTPLCEIVTSFSNAVS